LFSAHSVSHQQPLGAMSPQNPAQLAFVGGGVLGGGVLGGGVLGGGVLGGGVLGGGVLGGGVPGALHAVAMSLQQSPFLAHIPSHQQPLGAWPPQWLAQDSEAFGGAAAPGQKAAGAQTDFPLLVPTQQPEGQLLFEVQSSPQRKPRPG
jgi:hypothetical protein